MAHVVYQGNRWIITTDSLTQVTQIGLFKRTSSQLSLANLEDVTVNQNGLFQSLVGYGTLRVETAGERSKFVFPFCPNPNKCAKEIIGAHEAYIAENPAETYRSQRPLANVAAYNQSYAQPQPAEPQQPQYVDPNPQAANPAQAYGQPQSEQPVQNEQQPVNAPDHPQPEAPEQAQDQQ